MKNIFFLCCIILSRGLTTFCFGQNDSLKFPTLLFERYSTEIDSSSQDSLNYVYVLMIENPTMIIQVSGLFEHEKDFSPFKDYAIAVKKRLVEMGIPKERIKTYVEKYSEINDPAITADKANVIFKIILFNYVPTPP